MTLFPFMECCHQLAIDPKTLRHWLQQSAMSLHVHPLDGRRKCLTHEQVHHLAALHHRLLLPDAVEASLAAPLVETAPREAQPEPAHPSPMSNAEQGTSAVLFDEEALHQRLSQLEAQVIAQPHQLILLTQDLLRERAPQAERPLLSAARGHTATRPLQPAEQRARFLVLPPLIEYGATGTSVVISSQEGEIPLIADSPQWFEWFQTLPSFRFVGKAGSFGAARGYSRRPTRTWYAYRTIHQHAYKHYLGLSQRLTVAHLEAMAAQFQSYVDAL